MQQVTNIQEIEMAVNRYGEIVISKNNKNDVIIMSMEEYMKKSIKEDIIKKLKKAEEEIENEEGIDSDVVFEELRQKYEY
ncbi:MAG: type II toxin-antitoxin system prevent-host-death family antitoxin [Clostridia bacterium]|nr:type II toxin-antitoxin system prevent-host-death family antitoxin [Clostridia bacterium]